MFIDCKVSIWKRIHLSENANSEKVIQALEEDRLDDVYDDELFVEQEILYETAEEMTPKENGGHSTIEAYSAGDLIWSNGKS